MKRRGPFAFARPAGGRSDSSPATPTIKLLQEELAAAATSGRAVFLHVSSATDSTVRDFVRHARRANRRLHTAVASAADPATPAWRQVALRLTGRHRVGAALRRSLEAWVGMVPLVGPLISAIMNTADALSERAPSVTAALGTGSSIDDVRRILAHGRSDHRLIVLERCETADAAELAGAFALIQQLATTRTLLLVTAMTDDGRPGRGFTDLLWEAERVGVGRRVFGSSDVVAGDTELIRCAAALGEPFEVAQLVHLLGGDEARMEARLGALVRADLFVLRETIERNGELVDVYGFVDPLQRDHWRNDAPSPAPPADPVAP